MIKIDVGQIVTKVHTDIHRRQKFYRLTSEASVYMHAHGTVSERDDPFPLGRLTAYVEQWVQERFEGKLINGKRGQARVRHCSVSSCPFSDVRGSWAGNKDIEKGGQFAWLYVSIRLEADKPSHLPTEQDATTAVWGSDGLLGLLRRTEAGIIHAREEEKQHREHAERVRLANVLFEAMREEIQSKAREAIKYEQRMVELRIDYERAKREQYEALAARLRVEGDSWTDGTRIDPKLLEAALEALDGNVYDDVTPGGLRLQHPHPFHYVDAKGMSEGSYVDPEQL